MGKEKFGKGSAGYSGMPQKKGFKEKVGTGAGSGGKDDHFDQGYFDRSNRNNVGSFPIDDKKNQKRFSLEDNGEFEKQVYEENLPTTEIKIPGILNSLESQKLKIECVVPEDFLIKGATCSEQARLFDLR